MATKRKAPGSEPSFFTKRNWQWLGAGAVVIIAGFIALSMGSITLAPLLLVIGYCVLIPVGILVGPPKQSADAPAESGDPETT
jgi:uncharacterized membrane protein HdeD (DUF308 family)